MRSEQELAALYLRHRGTVWNICYPFFLNSADTEDAMQDTFVRLACCGKVFRDAEHEKAWLITTARNICKDELKRARRKNIGLDAAMELQTRDPEIDETLRLLHSLPERYRAVLYLHYYEGYPTASIARMLGKPEASIRSDLRRGRIQMRKRLEAEQDEKI